MLRGFRGLMALTALGLLGLTALTQEPGEKGFGKKGGPPKWEPGRVIPAPIRDMLQLNEEQEQKIDALEKDVKTRLLKILTPEQVRRIEELKGPAKKGRPKEGDDKGPPPLPEDEPEAQVGVPSGIQWYATLESGLREAKRTGRPILLVSAAPHCAGVCGVW